MNLLKSISFVKLKVFTLMLFILFVILFTALIVYEEYHEFQKEIASFKKEYLQNQKEMIKKETLRALRYISYKHHTSDKNLSELKKEIVDAIEYMRNERDGTGYIFIYTYGGVNVADPVQPHNKGKNLLHFKDPNGKEVIKELIEVSKQSDGGYVEYVWLKPTSKTLAPKISYAKAYEPFGWMVGSGVYLDDIQRIIAQKEEAYKDKMIKYIINIITLSFILFAATVMVMRYISLMIEHSLTKIQTRFNEAAAKNIYIYTHDLLFEEFKTIATYANKMIKIIKERTKKLQELNKTLEMKVLQKTKKLHTQNEELKRSKELSEKLLKDQDKFLKTAIHEINTPLSIILSNIDLLKMDGHASQEITNIESGIKIINNIYNDLAYLLKKDRVEYPKELIDLSRFLQNRIEFFGEVAKGNRLSFHTRIAPNVRVSFNPIELQRLIDNNLSNAIKYSEPNSTIEVTLTSDPVTITFSTKSKPIADKTAIFDQFYREASAKGGFGLGLALVKEICDKYGCAVEVVRKGDRNHFIYRIDNENTPA